MLLALIRVLALFWGFFGDNSTHAEVTNSPLMRIDLGEPTLLFLADGRVARVPQRHGEWIIQQKTMHSSRFGLQVSINEKDEVLDISPSPRNDASLHSSFESEPREPFEPSILEPKSALMIFKNMNPNFRSRSQCYNRAHIWAYEAFKNYRASTMKVFMFFTTKYIRDYNYRWWFHVSPFAYVLNMGKIEEQILDYAFMTKPVSTREWSNYFIHPHTECPTVQKFTDYTAHEYEHYCYFMKVPMYYWQPRDLEALESEQASRDSFDAGDINYAYWQAF